MEAEEGIAMVSWSALEVLLVIDALCQRGEDDLWDFPAFRKTATTGYRLRNTHDS